jgi:photosystem II stability/assembly factor-like uncharacterized protein
VLKVNSNCTSLTACLSGLPTRFGFIPKLVGLLCLMILSAPLVGAAPKNVIFHGTPHDNLFDVSLEGKNGVAVGEFGLVVETEDGGESWSEISTPLTELSLFGVVRKQGKCIAVGQQGTIFRASDCQNWVKVDSGSNGRLLEVDVNNNGLAFTVGGFGEVRKSLDGGQTWQQVLLDWDVISDGVEPHLYSVNVSEAGVITLAGEFELILRSVDQGEHWEVLHRGEKSIFSTYFLPNGEGYAVGQEGLILKSDDNGISWKNLESHTAAILTSVWANTKGIVQITGINTLLSSNDGGRSISNTDDEVKSGWYQAAMGPDSSFNDGKVIVVGSGAAIYAFDLAQDKNKSGEIQQ